MLLESLAVFLLASMVLVKSASFAVKSVSDIAGHFRFSDFFIAFVLAGFISTMPELFIGVNSALIGQPDVGLGTIIGSNIADMTIVVGLIALVGRQIKADAMIRKNNFYFLAVTSLPVLLMLDGGLSRDDGLILVLAFFFYMSRLFNKEKIFAKKKRDDYKRLLRNIGIFALSMAVLFVSAHFIVEAAVNISLELLIPSIIVGLFLVSFGTTLPELTFSLRAVLAKHKEIALGDIMGNVAIDSTFSIGIVALLGPVSTGFTVFATSMLFMVFSALLVITLLQNHAKITWEESFLLFFLYAMFVIIELKGVFV